MKVRRLAFALGLVLVAAAVVAIVLGAQSPAPRVNAGTPVAYGATPVERRNLTETDTEPGTLSYANPQTVYNRLSGTITWLPAVGQVIHPGQPLFDVDGRPVLLMDGSTPAYRALKSSDSAGQDVLELNRNLVKLGFDPDGISGDDTWQAATTAGVDALQSALGGTETGSLSLGKVVFLPGDQLVSAVNGALGNTVSDRAPTSAPEFVDLTTTPSRLTKRRKRGKPGKPKQTLQALTALLQAEVAELKASSNGSGNSTRTSSTGKNSSTSSTGKNSSTSNSGKSTSGTASRSGGPTPATAVLQTSSTRLVVTVDLAADRQSEATVGEPVTVELPAGNSVNGRITAVSSVAQSASGSGGSGTTGSAGAGSGSGSGSGGSSGGSGSSGSTIPVTITLAGRHSGAGLDQASVSVSFSQAKARNVLSVPVTSLLATAGGGYAVQEAAPPHALLPVTTGLFAAGYVQISGSGIYPGLAVTDSQG